MIDSRYDIIGDIHGCADKLEQLLKKLGYQCIRGVWQHSERKVVFLGDFIDRCPQQAEVLQIVRPMIDAEKAYTVMGNHEFNAIAYFTESSGGGYLRPHTDKNQRQHASFLAIYEHDRRQWKAVVDWFKELPLWLELDGINVVHATWDRQLMTRIKQTYPPDGLLTEEFIHRSNTKGTWEFEAVDSLLKGKEISLPGGLMFRDQDGIPRHAIRVRWWDTGVTTYREAFIGSPAWVSHIPEDLLSGDYVIEYAQDSKPLFLGHYWLEGEMAPLAANIACVDYSAAKKGGKLVAYRWDGEKTLATEKFIAVEETVG